jgi:ubiquitin C-terminal hydrolase
MSHLPNYIDLNKYHDKGNTGLVNLGNTCFLNSCIQVLNHTFELVEFLKLEKIQKTMKANIPDTNIIKEWMDLRDVMWSNTGTVSPNKFVFQVHQNAQTKGREIFTGWAQNDLSEFLLFMIECMHNSISREIEMNIHGTPQNELDETAVQCYHLLKSIYTKEYSEIMELYYGVYMSEIYSTDGITRHALKPESFFILDLPIPVPSSDGKISIEQCFDLFTEGEIMEGENAWFNEKTNQKENIQKKISFWNLPHILVITLKRFSPDGNHKRNDLVQFPIDDMDLSNYVKGYNPESYKYELFGVCNHIGSTMGGHYTTFVKNAKGEWVHYNDETIDKIDVPQKVITPMAYCLFYRKKNSRL